MANAELQFLLVFVCILVTQTTKGAFGAITKAPLNRVVYEGATNTKITCESDAPVLDWRLYSFVNIGNHDISFITIDGEFNFPFNNESFAINHVQGTQVYTLVILNATISPSYALPLYPFGGKSFSTAGLYECVNYYTDLETHATAYLVVIRSDPVCSSNFTQSTEVLQSGDVIQLFCTIVYNTYNTYRTHDIDAVMTWSVNGQPIPADNVTFTVIPSQAETTALSTLIIKDNFDATYECGTTFSPPVSGFPNADTNAPDYFKTCIISHP